MSILNERLVRYLMLSIKQVLPPECRPILIVLHPEGQDVISNLPERDVLEVFASLSAQNPDVVEVVSARGARNDG